MLGEGFTTEERLGRHAIKLGVDGRITAGWASRGSASVGVQYWDKRPTVR